MSELPLISLRKPLGRLVDVVLIIAGYFGFAFFMWALAVLLIGLAVPDAFAQEVSVADRVLASPALDILIDGLLTIFGPVALGLVLALLARLYAWLGLKQTAENRATVEQVLDFAVRFARAKYLDRNLGGIAVKDRPDAIHAAAEYAMARGPKALGAVGVTDVYSGPLQDMIEARLDDDVIDPEADTVTSRPIGFGAGRVSR